jgi:hypothetical protein
LYSKEKGKADKVKKSQAQISNECDQIRVITANKHDSGIKIISQDQRDALKKLIKWKINYII